MVCSHRINLWKFIKGECFQKEAIVECCDCGERIKIKENDKLWREVYMVLVYCSILLFKHIFYMLDFILIFACYVIFVFISIVIKEIIIYLKKEFEMVAIDKNRKYE